MTDAAAATTWDTRVAGWEGRVGRVGTAVAVALVVQAISFFFYSHHFRPLYKFNERLTESYGPLCADPFTHAPIGEPQVRHRILGPLIAYAVGLRGVSGVAVLPAAVTVFLILLYLFARRWLPPASAVGAVLLMATTPVVIFSQTGLGYPDVLGHIALLLCLMTATAWPVVPILFLGMLGDERCAAAIPLVVLWHFWADSRELRWWRAVARVVAAAVAVAAWVAVYRWIQLEFVGPSGGDNRSFAQTVLSGHWLKEGLPFVPLGMYFALRAAWLFPAMFTVVWWARRAPIATRVGVLAAYWAAVGVAVGQGVLVVDVSRCVALCWPGVIIALRYLYHERPVAARHWLAAAVVLNLFTPNYNVFGRLIQPIMPLPIALATAPR